MEVPVTQGVNYLLSHSDVTATQDHLGNIKVSLGGQVAMKRVTLTPFVLSSASANIILAGTDLSGVACVSPVTVSFENLEDGTYVLTVTGQGFLPFSQSIQVEGKAYNPVSHFRFLRRPGVHWCRSRFLRHWGPLPRDCFQKGKGG